MAMFLNIIIFIVGLLAMVLIFAVVFIGVFNKFALAPLFIMGGMQATYMVVTGIDALSRWVGAVF